MPRALLSVSDKTGLLDLGRGLAARGFELVSTGGTARALGDVDLAVTNVSDVTGFPEMLDGRVKTLHPAIHGGILARRNRSDDVAALRSLGIALVDVVVVNLYPFERAASNPATSFDALVEEIDIGGPSLVRAAAKNFRDVLVVVDPADYPRLLAAIDDGPTLAFRFDLMRKAIAHTASYDSLISRTLRDITLRGERFERTAAASPLATTIDLSLGKIRDLRYGENPHQRAGWYRPRNAGAGLDQPWGLGAATILQGKELSFTNLLDMDSALGTVLEFSEPSAAIVKHTNPCGAAIGESAVDAYVRARDADPTAAFGGIVALNRPIDVAAAEAVVSTFIEAILAPAVDEDAKPVLARKPNMRVVVTDFSELRNARLEFRSIAGAMLVQDADSVSEAAHAWTVAVPDGLRVVTRRQPSDEEWTALRFAWRVCAHVKSNTVVFTDAKRTLAIGAGQMSRVDAVQVAVMKAIEGKRGPRPLAGSVVASDAFFPFRDGLDAICAAGATAVVQPGGSVRDAEVIAAADENGLAMVFTGRRHFRH
jgi:phosphoribosylaminoimidazolecarboxamide formyltransferase/IMP cyclohydrolase